MRASSTTLAAGILFFSHLAAGQSDQQTCTIQCSTSAFKATGCDFSSPNSTACACASPVYSTNLTQCATTQCSLSANDVKALVADGCKGFGAWAFCPFFALGCSRIMVRHRTAQFRH
ncbi:hypothetical protein B0H14DRAFT_2689121 [Mycena olivaceomarginata]|nr:hypothetical protein B0H14DRAFT_2689121 [Mycena olivaceomarginata]